VPDDDDMHTRDLGTLGQDGPQLAQFETPGARDGDGDGDASPGMGGALRQRPQYSPVAQPGMVSEIHWHTVKSEQRAPEPPHQQSRGMIGRFHDGSEKPGKGGHHHRRKKGKGRGH
jgi:hypothetical protein